MIPPPHPTITPEIAARLTFDAGSWFSCDDCFDLIDQFAEATPNETENSPLLKALRLHLAGCPACCEEAEALLTLVSTD
jgi:hypothetical protein